MLRRMRTLPLLVVLLLETAVTADEPPGREAIAGWIAQLPDPEKRPAAEESMRHLGPESREAFDAALRGLEGEAAKRAGAIRRAGLLGSLERDDAEALLQEFWEKDAGRIVDWYGPRFPRLLDRGPRGRDTDVVAAGGEAITGDNAGRIVYARDGNETGTRGPRAERGFNRVTIGKGEFGLVVHENSHLWWVVVGTPDGAALLSRSDGASTLESLLGKRNARDAVKAMLALTWTGAVKWSAEAAKPEKSALREKLAAFGKESAAEGLLVRVLSCFWGE